ncbi:hypothetical protein FXO37_08752 [Capsicum annuum]|nr:hypothetical protein FXO37_08752 [Capsicum annuum]
MGRGRHWKAAKKQQEDDIRHEILASSEHAGTGSRVVIGEKFKTPMGTPQITPTMMSNEKRKAKSVENWPKLATKQAIGENTAQLSLDLQKLKGTNTPNELGTASKKHKQVEKLLEKPWKNLFATNRLATKGMDLSFIPPTVIDGETVVEVTADDVAYENAK